MLPNFIVLGAEKAGTTALYNNLQQHPDIFIADKEPEFFSYEGTDGRYTAVTTVDAYHALFAGVTTEHAIGDVSTTYLPCPEAPARIQQYVPDAKLIATLRHPADRAYSRYWMQLKSADKDYTPEEFLDFFYHHGDKEPWRNVRERGMYGKALARYFALFDPEQIFVILHEALVKDSDHVYGDLLSFIGADPTFKIENTKNWSTGRSKMRWLRNINRARVWPKPVTTFVKERLPYHQVMKVRFYLDRVNTVRPPSMEAKVRNELTTFYREDILQLQDLLGRDLSHWLEMK